MFTSDSSINKGIYLRKRAQELDENLGFHAICNSQELVLKSCFPPRNNLFQIDESLCPEFHSLFVPVFFGRFDLWTSHLTRYAVEVLGSIVAFLRFCVALHHGLWLGCLPWLTDQIAQLPLMTSRLSDFMSLYKFHVFFSPYSKFKNIFFVAGRTSEVIGSM